MRQVEPADVLRVNGDRLYLLSESRGLVAFDLTDMDHPRELWHSMIVGIPVGVFVRDGVAVLAVTDWERRADPTSPVSVLRVLDVAASDAPQVRADVVLPGNIRDVHAVDDTFYVLHESGSDTSASSIAVTSFHVERGELIRRGEVRAMASRGSFCVGTTKIVFAHLSVDESATDLAFVDIDTNPKGTLIARGSARVRGSIPLGMEPQLDAEERFVRVITCRSARRSPPLVTSAWLSSTGPRSGVSPTGGAVEALAHRAVAHVDGVAVRWRAPARRSSLRV
jgi:hypothetical protein